MNLREEVKDIIDNRPTKEEIRQEKEFARHYKRQNTGRRRFYPTRKPYVIALIVMGLAAIASLVVMILANTFPADLTLIITFLILGLLLLSCFMFASRKKWKRITGIVISVFFVVICVALASFMGNTYAMLNEISEGSLDASGPAARSVDVTEEPFNIYITGIDQWEEEKGEDLERSDVNMIVTVNPRTKKVLLTSIPRDSYVKLHTAQQMDKLTHTGIYGVNETLDTVSDWMGVELNYYVKMNFTAVRDIINAMGGIRVYSPVAFDSSLRDYHYDKGWNEIGGREALFFARERHAFEGQDSVRVENQQRVMKAMIDKMTSSTTLLTRYGKIMDAAGRNLTTNMSAEEMQSLVRMQATDLSSWDVESQKIEGDYDMDYVASLSHANKYSVYRPKASSVKKCSEGIEKVMNPSASELKEATENRSMSFFVNLVKRTKESFNKDKDQEE